MLRIASLRDAHSKNQASSTGDIEVALRWRVVTERILAGVSMVASSLRH